VLLFLCELDGPPAHNPSLDTKTLDIYFSLDAGIRFFLILSIDLPSTSRLPSCPQMATDDAQLVSRLLAGDAQAFREFFDEYFERLYRFGMARTRGQADVAEEASQRALCRAVRKLDTFRGESSLFSWLAQICRNELADLLEVKQRDAIRHVSLDSQATAQREVATLQTDPANAPEACLEQADLGRLLRELLDGLPGRYGEILEWKYLEDLSTQQIADRLHVTAEAAQSSLQRARQALRSALAARGLDDSLLDSN
jgi:RNA polymerase sigma-70 factor (ECF subfamily)